MTQPRLSVLMSVFNNADYLEPAVRSILGQTYRDFELLIADDGSADRSPEIVEAFAAQDSRVRFERADNAGLTVRLNRLLADARGELIARMDGDDIAEPYRLQAQVDYLDAHPDCVAVGSNVTIIDPDGEPLRVTELPLDHDAIDHALITRAGQMLFHPAMVFRRDAIEKVGGYDERYRTAQDLDLFLKLAEVGRLANLAEPLVRYREHLKKVGHSRYEEQERLITEMLGEAYKRRGIEAPAGVLDTQRQAFDEADLRQTWAWWALRHGNLPTARKHARAAVRMRPWSPGSWKVLAFAVRGR